MVRPEKKTVPGRQASRVAEDAHVMMAWEKIPLPQGPVESEARGSVVAPTVQISPHLPLMNLKVVGVEPEPVLDAVTS